MNKIYSYSLVCLALAWGVTVRAEDEEAPPPKPKHVPRHYSEQVDFRANTFKQKTPEDLKKEEEQASKDLGFDESKKNSSSSPVIPSRVRPIAPLLNKPSATKDDDLLLGNEDKKSDAKKTGWGWLADDIANSKEKTTSQNENTDSEALDDQDDPFADSGDNTISKNKTDVSDKKQKPLNSIALDLEKRNQNWRDDEDGENEKDVANTPSRDNKNLNPFDTKSKDIDFPMTKSFMAESPLESALDARAADFSSSLDISKSLGERPKLGSSYSPTPMNSSFHSDSLFSKPAASSLDANRSFGSAGGLSSLKSSSFSSPYASSVPTPISAPNSSAFSTDLKPASAPSLSAGDAKTYQGIRTQTLPW